MKTWNEIINQCAIDADCTPQQARNAITAGLMIVGRAPGFQEDWIITGVGTIVRRVRRRRRYVQPATGETHLSLTRFRLQIRRSKQVTLRQVIKGDTP